MEMEMKRRNWMEMTIGEKEKNKINQQPIVDGDWVWGSREEGKISRIDPLRALVVRR